MKTETTVVARYLSATELAAEFGVSKRTIDRMIAAGEIVAYRIRGCVRIPRRDVEKYLEEHRADCEPRGNSPPPEVSEPCDSRRGLQVNAGRRQA